MRLTYLFGPINHKQISPPRLKYSLHELLSVATYSLTKPIWITSFFKAYREKLISTILFAEID